MSLTGSSLDFLSEFILTLSSQFAMKDLGPIHYFLGVQITQTLEGLILTQAKYARDILDRAQMTDCKPMGTPMMAKTKGLTSIAPYLDPAHYRSLVGALQYLTLTCPDLAYSVNFVSQFMHSPTEDHFKMVKRILRYVKDTVDLGLHFSSNSTLDLYAFSDVGWMCTHLTLHNRLLHISR
ncbi:uncharacterized mitochondrial protein AtMg00810-like [Juglans microcarpa x Juglans regia]|uniref:uncharacterized mitochondrial protein AtMg00810-like n=1 Tax=Juglans microcarpa x Juglans regia TaxID=2249226 RepID=UPI001B7E50F1|nr:uncharacterized mitochondrial protein AtMg00810-like [Juglans microcarpa x Juglans regia]